MQEPAEGQAAPSLIARALRRSCQAGLKALVWPGRAQRCVGRRASAERGLETFCTALLFQNCISEEIKSKLK